MKQPRLFLRVAIAIIVIIGFYSFALVIASGLMYVFYKSLNWSIGLAKVTLPCLASGVVILWNIIPRIDHFSSPGPRLTPEEQPKLFEQIKDIAERTRQTVPKEVYLIADENAWVAERGGFMGIGSRRVMGIGILLLQTLSVAEFRAVLAHEFGHYHGGDTKLLPWIYKTRQAIARTLQSLDEGLIYIVFKVYGKLFLRITRSLSRYQEYVADGVAARVESAQALSSGLRKLLTAGLASNGYWQNEFYPALNNGFLPPYAKGFEYFMEQDDIRNEMSALVEEEVAATVISPLDTHPPMGERLKALENYPFRLMLENTSAITLLEKIPSLEKELFISHGGDEGKSLKSTTWDNVGEDIYLPVWSTLTEKFDSILSEITLKDISDIVRNPSEFTRKVELHDNRQFPEGSGYLYSCHLLGAAISVKLASLGWKISAFPGDTVKLINQDDSFEPFKMINDLFAKKITILDWRLMCQKNGIYEVPLGKH